MKAKKCWNKCIAMFLTMFMVLGLFMTNGITAKASDDNILPNVTYRTHVQTYGWEKQWKNWGDVSGTFGKAKRLEAIEIKTNGYDGVGVEYRTHIQSYGWESTWRKNGKISGTSGQGKRLEAIQIRLTGKNAGKYDIYYRVHAQTYGWLGWVKNGEPAGTAGQAKRLEAIQIIVIKKGELPTRYALDYATDSALGCGFVQTAKSLSKNANGAVSYMTHVQTYGNQKWVSDGSIAGTSGEGKRLEAISIKVNSAKLNNISGGITYQTHVQSYGWQGWKSNGQASGTSGKGKRLEAIRIKLTGKLAANYDVYYRVHAQTYGWMGWAKNGATAGTAGLAKRLEAIQIVIVPKGEGAPNVLPAAKGTAAYRGTSETVDKTKIYVYSWNAELGDRLTYFKEKYPQYANSVEYVNLGLGGSSDEYKSAIENAITNGGEKTASIVAIDSYLTDYFLSSDEFIPLSDAGIKSSAYSNAYSFSIKAGTANGKVKALSWQACPGGFIYRTDIAKKVWGTSDPKVIQTKVKDWSTFLKTAKELKTKGYYMVSTPGDLEVAGIDNTTKNQLIKSGCVHNTAGDAAMQWGDSWYNDMSGNKVFGYFGCPWFVNWSMPSQGTPAYGKRNICVGPAGYSWGGTYLAITKNCPNKKLAALVIQTLCCDEDVMYKMADETLDYPNNTNVVKRLIQDGKGSNPNLGGQDPLPIYDENGKKAK